MRVIYMTLPSASRLAQTHVVFSSTPGPLYVYVWRVYETNFKVHIVENEPNGNAAPKSNEMRQTDQGGDQVTQEIALEAKKVV
jgi:hypothetical protein